MGEDLGKIVELMIDVKDGRVEYAVLSFGGILGVGDKYFAIPFDQFQVDWVEMRMILYVGKEKLENAPGFDKNDWPDFADDAFRTSIGTYYS